MLADFTPAGMQQGDLFAADEQSPRSEALMQVIDKINQGRLGKVYFAARGRDTGVDDETGATQPALHHMPQRAPRGEGIALERRTSFECRTLSLKDCEP